MPCNACQETAALAMPGNGACDGSGGGKGSPAAGYAGLMFPADSRGVRCRVKPTELAFLHRLWRQACFEEEALCRFGARREAGPAMGSEVSARVCPIQAPLTNETQREIR